MSGRTEANTITAPPSKVCPPTASPRNATLIPALKTGVVANMTCASAAGTIRLDKKISLARRKPTRCGRITDAPASGARPEKLSTVLVRDTVEFSKERAEAVATAKRSTTLTVGLSVQPPAGGMVTRAVLARRLARFVGTDKVYVRVADGAPHAHSLMEGPPLHLDGAPIEVSARVVVDPAKADEVIGILGAVHRLQRAWCPRRARPPRAPLRRPSSLRATDQSNMSSSDNNQ